MSKAERVIAVEARDPSHVTVIQITDSHLLQDGDGTLLGVPTREALRRVLRHIRRELPHGDLIVHTGDVADDGHPDSYRHLDALATDLCVPILCVPGNHDDRQVMTDLLGSGSVHVNCSARIGEWLIVALDSLVPNEEYGCLSESELSRLSSELTAHAGRPALVFLHHAPVPIGSEWMDSMGLRGAQSLLDTIDARPQVRAVAWGHNHQVFEDRRGETRLLATPATCFQFTPASRDMEFDRLAPGYRVFTLRRDGKFDTDVVRVPEAEFPIRATARA